MTKRGDGIDTCESCGSESLWYTEGAQGFEGEYVGICNQCGWVQGKKKSQQKNR